jgi:multicomponent Na+:H+ antiporter subunit G
MTMIAEIFGGLLVAIGAFFFVVGAVGIYRMPDVFTRIHAAGISDTAGAGLLLIGMMFFSGFSLVTVKLAIILGIIIFTSPIATHALAQASMHAGLEPILDDPKVMTGPGVAPEPAKARRAKAKPAAKSGAAAKRRRTGKAARTRKPATAKGRAKS